VVYIDHGVDFTVKSTAITSVTPGCMTVIVGTGDSNAGPVTFRVTVEDLGEPGKNGDTFSIEVIGTVSIYSASGILAGGNIQVHGQLCD
jgi:hypothetical protein